MGLEMRVCILYPITCHCIGKTVAKKKKKEGKGREGNRKGKGNEGKEKRRGEKSLIYFDLLFLDLQIWSELITGGAN